MFAPANSRGSWCILPLLAGFLDAVTVSAQIPSRPAPPPRSTKIASVPRACGCPDGRSFAIGATVFGRNSARVVVTGFRPDLPASASIPGGAPAACTDILVLGQVVELARSEDGRPFLRRRSVKRGTIHDVCQTKIHFVKANQTYDFFAGDGSALTLREEQLGRPPLAEDERSQVAVDEIELDENLTGRDLLELTRRKALRSAPERPEDSTFDSSDLKEGAYFVCRRRSRTAIVGNSGLQRVSASPSSAPPGKHGIAVPAGTLGRIEKSAGFRSEPLWLVEILPDSAPPPFLRSLVSFPGILNGLRELAYPIQVMLAASDLIEVNEYFDRSRTEWTRLGEASETSTIEQSTTHLPMLYARPVFPLDENLSMAERGGVFTAVQKATRGLSLVFRNPNIVAHHGILLVDEGTLRSVDGNAGADLWRRQCFLRMGDSLNRSSENASRPALFVSGADIKVFRPKHTSQVPPDYYAIDLELQLRANFSPTQLTLVCRFPLVPIDLTLIDMAQEILSRAFEFRKEAPALWRKD